MEYDQPNYVVLGDSGFGNSHISAVSDIHLLRRFLRILLRTFYMAYKLLNVRLYFEGWDYSISVYYSFVTLLTIGFGDFVPTFQPHQVSNSS